MTTAIYPNRQKDKRRVEALYRLEEFGSPDRKFYSPRGLLLAIGYKRMVYGDHGPYIEFAPENIVFENWAQIRPSRYPFYYGIWCPIDNSFITLYDQVRDVKHLPNPPKGPHSFRGNREEGYADYVPGRLYISPEEIVEPVYRVTQKKLEW